MKVIREELGEDNTTSDIRQFEESLEKLEADDTVKERIKKEIVRFKNVANSPCGRQCQCAAILRHYWICHGIRNLWTIQI